MAPKLLLAAAAMLSDADLDTRYDAEALTCLALNVYHESRGEPIEGQRAVAFVTLNRAEAEDFPDDVCGVVTQSSGASCQFGWVCHGSVTPQNMASFSRSLRVAVEVLAGDVADPTAGATYFVSSRLTRPSWTRGMTQTAAIDGHVFLRD